MNEATKEKYDKAIKEYLNNKKSLTQISKDFSLSRGKLTSYMKILDIKIINKQNDSDIKENIFDNINTEEKAYWLGFLYADGYISKDGVIELGLQERDLEHIKKFKKFLNSKNKICYRKNTKSYRLSFRNKHMVKSLKDKGVINNKSLILTYPDESILPKYLTRHFIRGFFDGDGYLGIKNQNGKTTGRLGITSGSPTFIKELIKAMNWKELSIRKDKRNNSYVIEWSSFLTYFMLLELYNNSIIYLDRKYEKFLIIQTAALSQKS